MNAEIASLVESLDERFGLLANCVRGLSAEQLDFRPAFEGANSVWVLATHTIRNARAWPK